MGCKIKNCQRPVYSMKFCRYHYQRDLKIRNEESGNFSTCKVSDCEDIVRNLGLCNKHYKRFIRHGNTNRLINTSSKPCSVDGCERQGYGTPTLCNKHHHRFIRHGDPTKIASDFPRPRIKCRVLGCSKTISKKKGSGLCVKHFQDLYKLGMLEFSFEKIFGEPPYVCYLCGHPLDLNIDAIEIDHIIPRSKGGKNIIGNLKLTDKICNQSKRNLTDIEFIELSKKITAYNSS